MEAKEVDSKSQKLRENHLVLGSGTRMGKKVTEALSSSVVPIIGEENYSESEEKKQL